MAITTKPSIDRFIDLINYTNKTSLVKGNLVVGPPAVLSTTAVKNTSVLITSTPGAPHRGKAVVVYHRMNLVEVYTAPKNVITITLADVLKLTVTGLVGLLNTSGGTKLHPDEVESTSLNITKLPATYTLKAKPESYAYTGSVSIQFKAKLL